MKRILFICLVTSFALFILPFSDYMKNRPLLVKLGFVPSAQTLKVAAADFRNLASALSMLKVLFYYGTLSGVNRTDLVIKPEFFNMYRITENAVKLDPYNMDAYYFAEAAFTWEVGHAADVNKILDFGMKYRTWDYWLPFYAGFNSSYFLHDYGKAADYFKRAAEMSGQSLYANLAARYLYESGKNRMAIHFLDTMIRTAKDPDLKRVYETRREALIRIEILSEAVARYRKEHGRLPSQLDDLVTAGDLKKIPADPYGGKFYLDDNGIVRTTSKLAFQHSFMQ